jgi:Transposase and inactivated derivatives
MSNLYWLSDAQMARLEPFFPKSHGRLRVDDRRVLSGIIFINRNGLRWRDAPAVYGPHKTLYNRWKRWSDKGIFAQMMAGLAAGRGEEKTVMFPSRDIALRCPAGQWTRPISKRTERLRACGRKRGMSHCAPLVQAQWRMAPDRSHQRRYEHQTPRGD